MIKHIIKNEKEYKTSKSSLKKAVLGKEKLLAAPESKEQPWLKKAQLGPLQGFINHIQEEIEEYEALKSGKIKLPGLDSLNTIPELLIKKRIANGWTLEQMARRLGMHYQQIQRYENTEYESATFRTLQKIAYVLNNGSSSKKPRKAAAYRLKRTGSK